MINTRAALRRNFAMIVLLLTMATFIILFFKDAIMGVF